MVVQLHQLAYVYRATFEKYAMMENGNAKLNKEINTRDHDINQYIGK